jgi:hypothetical protein
MSAVMKFRYLSLFQNTSKFRNRLAVWTIMQKRFFPQDRKTAKNGVYRGLPKKLMRKWDVFTLIQLRLLQNFSFGVATVDSITK